MTWNKINRMQGATVLAVIGTAVVTIFVMTVIGISVYHNRWDFADKWLTMLWTSLLSNAFLGYLYVKQSQKPSGNSNDQNDA